MLRRDDMRVVQPIIRVLGCAASEAIRCFGTGRTGSKVVTLVPTELAGSNPRLGDEPTIRNRFIACVRHGLPRDQHDIARNPDSRDLRDPHASPSAGAARRVAVAAADRGEREAVSRLIRGLSTLLAGAALRQDRWQRRRYVADRERRGSER